jgi:hypothetical protein
METSTSTVTAAELREIRLATLLREKQERDDRLNVIMKEHVSWIKTLIPSPSELRKLAGQPGGRSSVIITQASPPRYRGVASPPETTYFTGFDGKDLKNPSGGEPILKLWLGARKSVDGVPVNDPSSLPNGKTVVDLLNEEYADKGHVFCPVWASPTRVELHMVWDEDGWKNWLHHRAERSRKQTQQARLSSRQKQRTNLQGRHPSPVILAIDGDELVM